MNDETIVAWARCQQHAHCDLCPCWSSEGCTSPEMPNALDSAAVLDAIIARLA